MNKKEKTILIAEDDPQIFDVLTDIIKDMGHSAIGPAKNKSSFNHFVKKNTFNLMLLDIHLKNDTDGINCLLDCYAHGYCQNTPVLFISADNSPINISRVAAIENTIGFIVKPFHQEEISTQIQIALLKSTKIDPSLKNMEKLMKNLLFRDQNFNSLEKMLKMLGEKLKIKRKSKRITQQQISELLQINYRHYQNIESGKVNLRMETFLKIINYII